MRYVFALGRNRLLTRKNLSRKSERFSIKSKFEDIFSSIVLSPLSMTAGDM